MEELLEKKTMKEFSGKQVIKAGEALIDPKLVEDKERFNKAFEVLSYWRFSHEEPLDFAYKILQKTTIDKDKNALFAKRLKRFQSIVNKLQRFPSMKLKNIQDIGGCRAIVSNVKRVNQIAREIKSSKYVRECNQGIRYKDYITNPKEDGYRGYHIVGRFPGKNGQYRNIELQIRTRLQHDWATALEIVDLFTGQALKSNQGDKRWKEFFVNVSSQFAVMESIPLFEQLEFPENFEKYRDKVSKDLFHQDSSTIVSGYIEKLAVFEKLEAFASSIKVVDEKITKDLGDEGYVLLTIDTGKRHVNLNLFDSKLGKKAEEAYSAAEKEYAKNESVVVALVSTTRIGGIKEAYPNYFADSSDFLRHLDLIRRIKLRDKRSILDTIYHLFKGM